MRGGQHHRKCPPVSIACWSFWEKGFVEGGRTSGGDVSTPIFPLGTFPSSSIGGVGKEPGHPNELQAQGGAE